MSERPGAPRDPFTQPPDKVCKCGHIIDPRRAALGYLTCFECGSPKKEYTVAPAYNKGGLQLITNPEDLKTIHKKAQE